jgi:hypothetical protein
MGCPKLFHLLIYFFSQLVELHLLIIHAIHRYIVYQSARPLVLSVCSLSVQMSALSEVEVDVIKLQLRSAY